MKSFVIKKLDSELEIVSMDYNFQGFVYKTRKSPKYLDITEVIIVNPEIISSLICYNFNKKYKKIIELYLNTIDNSDDTAEGNFLLALDEVARLKNIIINKYCQFLKKKEQENFLKRLKILENEIRVKIIDIKIIKEREMVNNNIMEEENVKAR